MNRSQLRTLRPTDITVAKDGDSFIALIGEDLQVGRVGVGWTECEAVIELDLSAREWADVRIFEVENND